MARTGRRPDLLAWEGGGGGGFSGDYCHKKPEPHPQKTIQATEIPPLDHTGSMVEWKSTFSLCEAAVEEKLIREHATGLLSFKMMSRLGCVCVCVLLWWWLEVWVAFLMVGFLGAVDGFRLLAAAPEGWVGEWWVGRSVSRSGDVACLTGIGEMWKVGHGYERGGAERSH